MSLKPYKMASASHSSEWDFDMMSTEDEIQSPVFKYRDGKLQLPSGIQSLCFSYLTPRDLISSICLLSEDIREYVCQTSVLDQ
jgi:hypothetical protein